MDIVAKLRALADMFENKFSKPSKKEVKVEEMDEVPMEEEKGMDELMEEEMDLFDKLGLGNPDKMKKKKGLMMIIVNKHKGPMMEEKE